MSTIENLTLKHFKLAPTVFLLSIIFFCLYLPTLGYPSANEELILKRVRALFEKAYSTLTDEALEQFRRGYSAYREGDFTQAISLLQKSDLHQHSSLGDYGYFFWAASDQQSGNFTGCKGTLEKLMSEYPNSTLIPAAKIQLANCEKELGNYKTALSLLRPFLQDNTQAMLLAANCYDLSNDFSSARRMFERIYYEFPTNPEAEIAAMKLADVKDDPPYDKVIMRVDALIKNWQYTSALRELDQLLSRARNRPKDEINLRRGICYYNLKDYRRSLQALNRVASSNRKVYRQALYYIFQAHRRRHTLSNMNAAARKLKRLYPKSNYTESALFYQAAEYETEARDKAFELYKGLAKLFPEGAYAGPVRWKILWHYYLAGDFNKSAKALTEYIKKFPSSKKNPAAEFWLAKAHEKLGHLVKAGYIYKRLAEKAPSSYYGQLAIKSLQELKVGPADAEDPELKELLGLAEPSDLVRINPNAMEDHIEKFRQLSSIKLEKLAFIELGALASSNASLAESEKVDSKIFDVLRHDYPNDSSAHPLYRIRVLKNLLPNYSDYQLERLPIEIWKTFYPLERWDQIKTVSEKYHLDPYLIAALIRQESAFDPNAVSSANAIGLMQVTPGTGRLIARSLHYSDFSTKSLYDWELNLRLGIHHLARLMDKYNGKAELALAAYNAGEHRLDTWLTRFPSEEIYLFIESIPITETREYVKAIVTATNRYKEIYRP